MWKRIAVVVAWVVATFATAAITLAAVGQAGRQVSERPELPVSAADLMAGIDTSTSTSTSTEGTTSTTPTTTAGGSLPSSSTTSTTAATSGSSTTSGGTILMGTIHESRTTAGGTVSVTATGETLMLASAIPAQGFSAEIHTSGTTEIEVRFESHDGSIEYRVKARLEDGEIRWEIRTDIDG